MAHYAGTAGQVDAASNVTGVKGWSIDYTVGIVDTTDFASAGVRDILPSVSQWSGSFEGLKDGAPLALAGASISLALKETQTATQKFTGSAYITGVHASVAHDGTVNYSYDFEGTGILTIPIA